jgi:hypothetical protein
MSLTPGTRLGPYEIRAQIGAGGMGEVYRATDTNLARQVAIKVLPAAMGADVDRIARFDREAKTLAALNHPNIAAIYGLEKADGQAALVMELVEGPTLAERIRQGSIPFDEAVAIAKQIAEALEAAHEQGVIHRDLKPANIKVRPDGTVKVLHKRHLLEQAINPVGEAERLLDAGRQAEPAIYRRIIEVIEMQNDSEKWQTTYETLIRSKMERLKSLTPEESTALRVEWQGLLEDVRRAIDGGEDPAGPVAQALAGRWLQRLERLMGAPMDAFLVQKAAAYQTTGKWSAGAVDKRVWDFMSQALAARA